MATLYCAAFEDNISKETILELLNQEEDEK